MCRYATVGYGEHYVCVPCRVSFKGDRLGDSAPRRCPTCAGPVTAMGLDFRPPRKRNVNQWRKIAMLIEDGELFRSCGCNGPGRRARTLADKKAERVLAARVKRKPVPNRL